MEVTREEGLVFSKNHYIEPGYWMIIGPDSNTRKSWKDDDDFKITKVDKEYYEKMKDSCADLLSHVPDPNAPIYTRW
jgi:hypothetical protein